jgi:hypothetical protein
LNYAEHFILYLTLSQHKGRQQAEVMQNLENEHIRSIGQGKARHRKYKRLKLGGGQAYNRSSD